MGTCLTTVLKEAVTDDSLLKLGELKLHVYPTTPNVIHFYINNIPAGETIPIEAKSPGYITDSTGTQNLGRTDNLVAGTRAGCYLISGDYDVIIGNKYLVSNLNADGDSVSGTGCSKNMGMNLEGLSGMPLTFFRMASVHLDGTLDDFKDKTGITNLTIPSDGTKKLSGDISALSGMTGLTTIYMPYNNITGDISALSGMTGLTMVSLLDSPLTGNVSSLASLPLTQVRLRSRGIQGTTATLGSMTSLQNIQLDGTSLSGSLSSLTTLTNLKELNVSNTNVVGDTSDLAGLTSLTAFYYANTAITGSWPLV